MKHLTILFLLAAMFCSAPAFSQTQWTKYAGNPVMNVGPSGAWDDLVVIANRIIRVQDTLKMWYSGSRTGFIFRIGYAWSTDSGFTWTKHPSNPIVIPTQSWELNNVLWPHVIFTGSQYQMWYAGNDDIGYAWSPDGIVWTKYAGNPVVHRGPLLWDARHVGWNCVLPDGAGGFKMWFEGWDASNVSQIGYATATDETTWTKADNVNPVLTRAPGTWEPSNLRGPRVLYNGQIYQMLYSGGSSNQPIGIGYAASLDGMAWTKESANPVLRGTPGSWDAYGASTGDVLFDGTVYHLWYVGEPVFNGVARVGYATALVTSVREVPGELPTAFVLEQNYPNPFNPSTVIRYQLPVTSYTTLKVYNLLGQEVATLVNEEMRAGGYEVTWDAAGFASGIYFYRLQTGSFIETKRMLLLR